MKTPRLQDVNKALGDLVIEAPFLSVEHYDMNEFCIYPQGWDDNRENLMTQASTALTSKGFIIEERFAYGMVEQIIVKGKN